MQGGRPRGEAVAGDRAGSRRRSLGRTRMAAETRRARSRRGGRQGCRVAVRAARPLLGIERGRDVDRCKNPDGRGDAEGAEPSRRKAGMQGGRPRGEAAARDRAATTALDEAPILLSAPRRLRALRASAAVWASRSPGARKPNVTESAPRPRNRTATTARPETPIPCLPLRGLCGLCDSAAIRGSSSPGARKPNVTEAAPRPRNRTAMTARPEAPTLLSAPRRLRALRASAAIRASRSPDARRPKQPRARHAGHAPPLHPPPKLKKEKAPIGEANRCGADPGSMLGRTEVLQPTASGARAGVGLAGGVHARRPRRGRVRARVPPARPVPRVGGDRRVLLAERQPPSGRVRVARSDACETTQQSNSPVGKASDPHAERACGSRW